jgi:hypothetical protein
MSLRCKRRPPVKQLTTSEARRTAQLRQALDCERIVRRQAEQKPGGLRGVSVRLQAQIAKQKADAAARKAEHVEGTGNGATP